MKQFSGLSVFLFLAACSGGGGAEPSPSASPSVEDTATEVVTETVAATDAAPVAVATPSFDCAKADGDAQKLVCSTPELAAMDRELMRLYDLALTGPHISAARKSELQATQRGWIKGRDDCWKADDKPACVRDQYAMRIHELRQGYADARADDAKGVSKGPLALACKGQDFLVSVTFVNTDPGAVWLFWRDQGVGLAHVVSASGALYEGQNYAGKASLFTKGDDAMLTLPGDTQKQCHFDEIG
ncbi:MliC family protein [Novosphingobium sp. BL-8H]|uniref:MliC family protein n=1 Tax=Novosphingobium sp. BL-8H TaxID=3127640 RepID=UPI003757E44F